jgi:hypothetical protein
MRKYYSITKNPDGYTSNFFIHTSFNPQNELKMHGIKSFIIKEIPGKKDEYAGIILGEVHELIEIQEKLAHNNWQKM